MSVHWKLFGPEPGQIDHSQPSRVLSNPNSKLGFAFYHPLTASPLQKGNTDVPDDIFNDEIKYSKRIVVESLPNGRSIWKFVPNAKREQGYTRRHEGEFPRHVDINGNIWLVDQDQWDIHKLDPAYECVVREKDMSVISLRTEAAIGREHTPRKDKSTPDPEHTAQQSGQLADEGLHPKRRLSSPSRDDLEREGNHKKPRRRSPPREEDASSARAEQAVEEVLDSEFQAAFGGADERTDRVGDEDSRVKKLAKERSQKRQPQRGSASTQTSSRMAFDSPRRKKEQANQSEQARRDLEGIAAPPDEGHGINPADTDTETVTPAAHDEPEESQGQERPTSLKPESSQGPLCSINTPEVNDKDDREAAEKPGASPRRGKAEAEKDRPRPSEQREDQATPDKEGHKNGERASEAQQGPKKSEQEQKQENVEEEAIRRARIEESRRKLAEMEKDRPLWDAVRRAREAHDREEQVRIEEKRRQRREEHEREIREREASTRSKRQKGEEVHEEAVRKAGIEESRMKLAILEKDRPLWDAVRKAREAHEREEHAALEEKKRQRHEQQERKKRDARERKIRRQDELRTAEDRQKALAGAQSKKEAEWKWRRERERWTMRPWSVSRALTRYKQLSEHFDKESFSSSANPLFYDRVPWPVLTRPNELYLEHINWKNVEEFFEQAQQTMLAEHYITFVDKTHKRFHPDRWRSRGLFNAVSEELDSGLLEKTVNIVAQAITPIWNDNKQPQA